MNKIINQLKSLYMEWAKDDTINIIPLAQSGSSRKYFRITSKEKTAIGVYNSDKRENKAFIAFSKHFLRKNLYVPKIYSQKLIDDLYLIDDLGDITLYSMVEKDMKNGGLNSQTINFYKEALSQLIRFQIDGAKGLDYSVCYPRSKFDKQSILWDLNYFKYYFVRLANISVDEQKLEDDFNSFTKLLHSADSKYFMYRDFQSRNIMIHNDQLFFIDYQGGKKGALQYDVASLLFQAKVNLSTEERGDLLEHYLNELQNKTNVKRQLFLKHYYKFVLIRLLQTLGAYGFRGYFENKSHFLSSIPYALKNLQWLLDKNHLPKKLPELNRVLNSILSNDELNKIQAEVPDKKLKITINSFSYRAGIPKDFSGNGGGFVFDCRSLENPGRYTEYKQNTGLDKNVIRFLSQRQDVKDLLNSVYSITDKAVNNYLERNFKNLMISFGCTGGQHRSVYCAENLVKYIKEKFDVLVAVNHIQLKNMDFL